MHHALPFSMNNVSSCMTSEGYMHRRIRLFVFLSLASLCLLAATIQHLGAQPLSSPPDLTRKQTYTCTSHQQRVVERRLGLRRHQSGRDPHPA